ncbi:MAG: DNA mismatch endonuclease Vsr [Armatimonadetes bacterium]|nr:DNA mismatch endonuclease Vsr [Armatimonadota bacterium]
MAKDALSPEARSRHMSSIRGKGNLSTEGAVEDRLNAEGIAGWEKHPAQIIGKPDFYFPAQRVALFVDGCFWHDCPCCRRNRPTARGDFWREKIEGNRRRDNRTNRRLRRQGIHVVRVWEHDVPCASWVKRLRRMLTEPQELSATKSQQLP